MRFDSCQFGSFDGRDNRIALMRMLKLLGRGLPEVVADQRRAAFLQSLIGDSETGLDGRPLQVTPCDPVRAYLLLVAITGCLGVPVEKAAKKLERVVRDQSSGKSDECGLPVLR